MASRFKEDEKNERIIRGLLKLPENRRCINCNSLGPQYVCTNFWTFVCTNCSGIHREFTHRVKSVSLAKFTSQEVAALQEGGNQRAKEIYFREWDPQRNSLPDSSNVDRLRDFIKHIYVDRRFTGERNNERPPRVKMGDKEDSYENRIDAYKGGSRSPPYEDTYDRRYGERSSPGGRSDDRNYRYNYGDRSPGYDSDYRRSPARPEIVNDWRREDRFGNGRKLEDRRISDGDSKVEGRSPERMKDLGSSSPPVVRPVREILGENVIPLRISEPPKANGSKTVDGPAHAQRSTSSNNLVSSNGNPAEVKLESTGSLIDFDAEPEPPVSVAVPQTGQSTVQPLSNSDNNWASFDLAPEAKGSQGPTNFNTFDSVLSQLSAPASVAGNTAGASGVGISAAASTSNMSLLGTQPNVTASPTVPFSGGASGAQVSNFSMMPPGGSLVSSPGLAPSIPMTGGNALINVNTAGQWPSMQQQQPSLFSAPASQSTLQQFMPPAGGASTTHQWTFSPHQNMQGPFSRSAAQAAHSVPKSVHEATSGASQSSTTETKSSGRKELPVDMFTATYSTFPAPGLGWQTGLPRGLGWQTGPPRGLGWQTGPPRGLGFPVQYGTPLQIPMFPQTSRSMNPFDINSEPTPAQPQTFPSMTSLQGALPNAPPPASFLRMSSLGTPPAWMPPQSLPYASATQTHAPPFTSAAPPGAYSGLHVPSSIPPTGHQVVSNEASAGLLNTDQQFPSSFPAPAATPQPFPSIRGNPFG